MFLWEKIIGAEKSDELKFQRTRMQKEYSSEDFKRQGM